MADISKEELWERLSHAYQNQDKKAIIELGALFGMRLVDEDIETYFEMFTPDMLADHMTKITKEQREWIRTIEESTNPQEIMETAQKLEMKPFTLEEAKDLAGMNERAQARRRTSQDEPEKGFTELLLEAEATEDLTKKEALYAKIVTQEFKHVLEGSGTIEF